MDDYAIYDNFTNYDERSASPELQNYLVTRQDLQVNKTRLLVVWLKRLMY